MAGAALKPGKGKRPGQGLGSGALLLAVILVGFVGWVHLRADAGALDQPPRSDPGWVRFKADFGIEAFGSDGYFVRAVKHGYHLFHDTYRYAWRFTRRQAGDPVRACADCHTPSGLAYAFVTADRFDPALGKRVSFEERLMRCYAHPERMDGFVPTVYDPAIRDLRILARAVAHHLELSEGEQARESEQARATLPLSQGPRGQGGLP